MHTPENFLQHNINELLMSSRKKPTKQKGQQRNSQPGQSSKTTTQQKRSSRHQSEDEVIFDTPGCHSPPSPSVFHVSRNMLDPSSAAARAWEQIQSAVRAFSNLSDHELSVTDYWFAHLGFVSQVKLFASSFGENKSLGIFFRVMICLCAS